MANPSSDPESIACAARGAVTGALAALTSGGIMLWASERLGSLSLQQILADRLIEMTPLWLFRAVLSGLEANTRPVALLTLSIGLTVAGAIGGALYGRYRAGHGVRSRTTGWISLTVLTWLLLTLVVCPAAGIGVMARSSAEPGTLLLVFTLGAMSFAALVCLSVPPPDLATNESPSRRRLMQSTTYALVAIPAIAAAATIGGHMRRMRNTYQPAAAFQTGSNGDDFEIEGMPHELTPTDAFYVVSKNFIDPRVDSSGWSLEIGGLVERPLSLSYTDMLLPESREFVATLECISNEVGGPYIGNAVWEGFPLSALLDRAGLRPGIVDLEIHAADGYIESLPIEKSMDDVMVVHSMNREPLTYAHGYPVRLIVPGRYGKKNVKWVTALNAVPEDIKGYWQIRGWSDTAFILTMSRIDLPENGRKVTVGSSLHAGGVAFGGDRGISKVEVSFDRGESWVAARLSGALSENAWRLWRADYVADEPGIRRIIVRATDGTGELQERAFVEPLPEGSTGWHERWFEVIEA